MALVVKDRVKETTTTTGTGTYTLAGARQVLSRFFCQGTATQHITVVQTALTLK